MHKIWPDGLLLLLILRIEEITTESEFQMALSTASSRYNERLRAVVSGILSLKRCNKDINSLWEKKVSRQSLEYWVDTINRVTLDNFKALLGGEHPPSREEFLKLECFSSNRPGVFLAVIQRADRGSEWHVYIGSATKQFAGLRERITQHKNKEYSSKRA